MSKQLETLDIQEVDERRTYGGSQRLESWHCAKIVDDTFAEIASRIGVCPQSAHRLHDRLIEKLRAKLQEDPYIKEWLENKKGNNSEQN